MLARYFTITSVLLLEICQISRIASAPSSVKRSLSPSEPSPVGTGYVLEATAKDPTINSVTLTANDSTTLAAFTDGGSIQVGVRDESGSFQIQQALVPGKVQFQVQSGLDSVQGSMDSTAASGSLKLQPFWPFSKVASWATSLPAQVMATGGGFVQQQQQQLLGGGGGVSMTQFQASYGSSS